jgi:signal peptidase I
MTDDVLLVSDDDIAAELRTLTAAAAPSLRARPDLARLVLDRTRTQNRRSRARRAGIVAGAGLLVMAAAAASRPGSGTHFAVIQPSAAMTPTVAIGEQVTFHKRLEPQRGDVVYAHITAPGFGHHTISRVVATGGDTVECPAAPGGDCTAIVVNGQPVAEPYLGGMAIAPFGAVHVPDAAVFLLGDARSNATDSRIYGSVGTDDVSGVAVRISANGRSRGIPGAPSHPAPHGGIDPADFPPQAPAANAG